MKDFKNRPIRISHGKSSTNTSDKSDLIYVEYYNQNNYPKCLGTYNKDNKQYADFGLSDLASFCSFSDIHKMFEKFNVNYLGLILNFI